MRPKYDAEQIRQLRQRDVADGPAWTETDLLELRRLVAKHGVDAVRRMATKMVPGQPGRPSRGLLPLTERMHLAQWLEEAAAEHKANGVRDFAAAAIHDLFMLSVDEEEQRQSGRFEPFAKTTKRKWIEGRKELIHYLEAVSAQHPVQTTRALAKKELRRLKWREK
jgi:hypothetical protein